ncbi:MAG: hypothetical protein ACRDL1_02645 [Solirubrobacterales bacterium]
MSRIVLHLLWSAAPAVRPGAILPEEMGPYVALLLGGFVVGVAGHVFRLRWMVALGILMIFLATFLLPVAINLLEDAPDPPGPNVPRPY